MSNSLALLALSMLSCLPAVGQNVTGTRLGLSIASVAGDVPDTADISSRTGFVGGLFFSIPLRGGFAVQPEVLYIQKGFRNDTPSSFEITPDLYAVLELTYLEVPVLLRYDLEATRAVTLSPHFGPYLAYELSERIREVTGNFEQSSSTDLLEAVGFGFAVGTDISVLFRDVPVLIGIRYTRGLTNRTERADAAVDAPDDLINTALLLTVGLGL